MFRACLETMNVVLWDAYLHPKFLLLRKYVCSWRDSSQWAMASSFTRFLEHTQRRTTVGRNSLDEWSTRRRETIHNAHNRKTSMPPEGFEPTTPAGKRPQTYALDRAATGTGPVICRQAFELDSGPVCAISAGKVGLTLKSSGNYIYRQVES